MNLSAVKSLLRICFLLSAVLAPAHTTTLGFAAIVGVSPACVHVHQAGTTTKTTTKTSKLFAKKKKGGKQQQRQRGGFEWASSFVLQPWEARTARDLASTAVSSFRARTGGGEQLDSCLDDATDIPKALWKAPVACVIVREGIAGQASVQYANVAALETVGLKPDQFEQLFTTSPQKRGDLSPDMITLELPPTMKGDKKFERGYSKKMLRVEGGDDVKIVNAYRWLLEKTTFVDGKIFTTAIGVGYAWSEWIISENILCRPGGKRETLENLTDLDDRIASQAALIRDLKENKGLGNKDPKVVEAVAELLRLKDLKQ